jgi:cytoskeletal protein RodZ
MAHQGRSLKALRESKQIKLRSIANETRIGLAYLQDLEEERFDRFPGKFYFRSFVREYAVALGLDPTEVVDDLLMAYEDWSGERAVTSDPSPSTPTEEGLFNRIAGYLRGVQSEV